MSAEALRLAADRPLTPLRVDRGPATDESWFVRASWWLVALGILARLVRYLVDYPIWHDEAFVAASLWNRSFGELAQPLEYGQVAPWLFLVVERIVVLCLGYSELTLRLFPTVCSILSVVVFRHLASRLLRGWALVLATAVFACAFYPIRHGNEIKPYSADLLAAVSLLTLAVEYLRKPDSSRWLWIASAALPVLLGLSYPAVFVAGAICLALAPVIVSRGSTPVRLGFVAYGLMLVGSFLAIYMAATVVQQREMGSFYRLGYWKDSFPPLDQPWWIPVWLLDMHSGNMMAYPVGERKGGSVATLACALVGCLALWRRDRRTVLAFLTLPFGLGLVAAFLGRYPYGGEARIMQYLAPSICLLAGLGMAALFARLSRPALAWTAPRVLVTAMALLAVGLAVRDLAKPYRVAADLRAREFARRFWVEQSEGADLACLKSDLGVEFDPHTWRAGMSAVYLFYQRLYSPRHRSGTPFQLDRDSYTEAHPLRLVVYNDLDDKSPPMSAWLSEMDRDYRLRRSETFVVDPGKSGESWLRDVYGVFEFVAREPARTATVGGPSARY
ncbi:MAG: hypothetical protein P4L85_19155 [Paludisphaera borealis]|uniref:hypothetical protein n=1 Tax=Paludisphaera borealis TaxID=1387353 RepID=UPI00284B6557|nr:hypothetical protein [Paludisphaera borealis]MDR3621477.1 hypothetical protein [Paludisphaera borealis]